MELARRAGELELDLQPVRVRAGRTEGRTAQRMGRIHPFAKGDGRTARVWAAFLALRYGLPVFVQLKPRPGDIAYARAAMRSMGRPPGFDADHGEAVAVFAHLLTLSLLP